MKHLDVEIIEGKILFIRGKKVILGHHLADLYKVETRALIQAVKRNKERFPADFAFSLTREEILRISQSVTSLKFSKSVYAFTEQGIAMLSSVLHSNRAVQVNIAIMRSFVRLREIISMKKEFAEKLKQLEVRMEKHDTQFKVVFEAMRRMMIEEEKTKTKIGFHP